MIPISGLRKQVATDDGTASTPSISFSNDLDTGLYRPAANTVAMTTNATERLRVTSTGNVGIGTTDPQTTLHCNGSMRSGTTTQPAFSSPSICVHNFSVNKVAIYTLNSYDIVTITEIPNFFQVAVFIEYGTRLQGISDNITNPMYRTFGVNRFNSGALVVTETHSFPSTSNALTHAPIAPIVISDTELRIRITFSASLGGASFAAGQIRIFGVASGLTSITVNHGFA